MAPLFGDVVAACVEALVVAGLTWLFQVIIGATREAIVWTVMPATMACAA